MVDQSLCVQHSIPENYIAVVCDPKKEIQFYYSIKLWKLYLDMEYGSDVSRFIDKLNKHKRFEQKPKKKKEPKNEEKIKIVEKAYK